MFSDKKLGEIKSRILNVTVRELITLSVTIAFAFRETKRP